MKNFKSKSVIVMVLVALLMACGNNGVDNTVGQFDTDFNGPDMPIQVEIHQEFDVNIVESTEEETEQSLGFLEQCSVDGDCESRLCIETVEFGQVCTVQCYDSCPEQDWTCVLNMDSPAEDQQYICVPPSSNICAICISDENCPGGQCMGVGETGTYCTYACNLDTDCPEGYSCTEVRKEGEQELFCLPDTGSCVCTAELDGTKRTCSVGNEFGKCFGTEACNGPEGWSECDAITPAEEICDGLDNDCDGLTDEGMDSIPCYKQNTFGTCEGVESCQGDEGWVCSASIPEPEICDGVDNNCDGVVDEGFELKGQACDSDDPDLCIEGVWACSPDGKLTCKGDKSQEEVCDGYDNDCDGSTDEGYIDTDGDDMADCIDSDDDNDGVPDIDDCKPFDPLYNKYQKEVCDGVDNNCDSVVDEGFIDTDNDNLADCVDSDDDNDGIFDELDNCPLVANPGQDDLDEDWVGDACDLDDDNDGIPDTLDNCSLTYNPKQVDTDSDKVGDVCDMDDDNDGDPDTDDCAPFDSTISHFAEEICDNTDNNCDGVVDEEESSGCELYYVDSDGDGYGEGTAKCLCGPSETHPVTKVGDCNDLDPEICPDAQELCDDVDNNCDGKVDEGFPFVDSDLDQLKDCIDPDDDNDGILDDVDNCPLTYNPDQLDNDVDKLGDVCDLDDDNDGDLDVSDCKSFDSSIHQGAEEICDGVDNNCNTLVDEGFINTDSDKKADCVDEDDDNDEILDDEDNCPLMSNPKQLDFDVDGIGDICDLDDDNDGDLDITDCAPFDPAINHLADEVCDGMDNNCDGQVDEGQPDYDDDGTPDCFDPVPPNLVGYWGFNSSTSADTSGHGNDGVPKGNPVYVEGVHGKGMYFDKSYLDCGDGQSIQLETEITIAFWVKSGEAVNMAVLGKYNNNQSGGWRVFLTSTGQLGFGVSNGTGDNDLKSTPVISITTWTHVVCTYDKVSGNRRIYINGTLNKEQAGYVAGVLMSQESLTLGRYLAAGSQISKGISLDEVRLYNVELNPEEVLSLYQEYSSE